MVPRLSAMTDVVFLASQQGYQANREQEIADRLRADRPDLTVRTLSPADSVPLLTKYKLKFGPAVVIDERLEFIGIPRYRMLLERIEISKRRAAVPPPAPAAATPVAAAPKPSVPAAAPPPPSPRVEPSSGSA